MEARKNKMSMIELENAIRAYRIDHGVVKTIHDALRLLRAMLKADTANLRAYNHDGSEPKYSAALRMSLANSLTTTTEDAWRVEATEARLQNRNI